MDGYGITECGSLACLSNPCRNGARCVEVQGNNNNNNGLPGGSARRESSSRWSSVQKSLRRSSGQILKGEGGRDESVDGHSIMMNDYRTRTRNNNHDDDDDYLMMDEDELAQDNRNWQCKCPTGYIGPTCEISVCDNNPCQYGGTCIPYPGSGYLCLCPFGKHGHYCEHSEYLSEWALLLCFCAWMGFLGRRIRRFWWYVDRIRRFEWSGSENRNWFWSQLP